MGVLQPTPSRSEDQARDIVEMETITHHAGDAQTSDGRRRACDLRHDPLDEESRACTSDRAGLRRGCGTRDVLEVKVVDLSPGPIRH